MPLSLRLSDVEGGVYRPPKQAIAFEDIYVGMVTTGVVKSVTEFGIFLRIDNSKVDALCYKTEVSDEKLHDLRATFEVGAPVRLVVLRTNPEKKQPFTNR